MTSLAHADNASEDLKPGLNRVTFMSEGQTIVGHLYLPSDYTAGKKLPAAIVTGSWLTVKEQMAGLYAQKLADKGIAALAFDFRHFGESGGEPRQIESPTAKTRDIVNAVTYLQSLPAVDAERIGGFGICASAGYMAMAVAADSRLKAYVAVAPWLHDADLVKTVYGGEAGVRARLESAATAGRSAQPVYVPAISTTDPNAAMYGEFDYYLNPERGAIAQWDNRFAVQSWSDWLTFSAMPAASKIRVPVLFVHSEQAAIPNGAKKFFAQVEASKIFMWMNGSQFDFYDQPVQVNTATDAAVSHFRKFL